MGLLLINKIKAVISTHQLLIQYEKDDDHVGVLYGDQKSARECQVNSLKMGTQRSADQGKKKRKVAEVESVMHDADDDARKITQPQPLEGYEEVAL